MSSPRSLSELRADHTPEAVERRLSRGPQDSYVRDFVYGAIDGAVTTFAVVSGVAGAGLASGIILILGVANLLGDGFSMAASNFLAVRAEGQRRDRLRRLEEAHIAQHPEGEREEIRQIFREKGFIEADLERVVGIITSDRRRWVETMLTEEYGLALRTPSPWRAALATFSAFLLVGAIPLAPFLLEWFAGGAPNPYLWSTLFTGLAFFFVGALKGRFVEHSWYVSGAESLAVGGAAAGLAYAAGAVLGGWVG